MRPIRLTMQAFGPYAEREVIDFRDAVEAGLFGIYGQTGSGKSTIFSAMTFALFGEPAKTEQDAPSLRSDHADPGLQTEVEFVFDIGVRRFVILRRPEQMRPMQRGDGETRNLHEAFLFDATEMALDDIKDGQHGKIVAEKKVRDVDTAVSELLGYGSEQFRQIVLLPQGRFEAFLAAKTKERLEILRDLFDVSLYRNLATKLKTDADAAERQVREEREVCARRLTADGFESTDALTAGVEEDRSAVEEHRRKLENAKEAASKATDAIQGQVRPDLLAVETKLHENEAELTEATNLRSGAKHRLDHLTRLRDELAETLRKLDEAEVTSGSLRNLAALFDGKNPQNLDLETFAIGAMFDQVLTAANLRLGPMTANRYRLERDLEGTGRGRRGLGIQVFDIFTGKARPTTTLSGGETFIAALALALGLADVVESASGKVRLDTIFIDEGFGSLDSENGSGTLDQVLQVLSSLVSQNRAVGLISHVPLVQEAIPNGFYVHKELAGSRVEARGLV